MGCPIPIPLERVPSSVLGSSVELGTRLMVGQRILVPYVGVRLLRPQPTPLRGLPSNLLLRFQGPHLASQVWNQDPSQSECFVLGT